LLGFVLFFDKDWA